MAATAATSPLPFRALLPTRSPPSQKQLALPRSGARRPPRCLHARRKPDAALPGLSIHRGAVLPRPGLSNLTPHCVSAPEEGGDGGGAHDTTEASTGSEASAGGGENAEATARRMLNERGGGGGGGDLWAGVGEEVREIEWPPFGKVVGTTGVVLAVIAGSSVALLTVNAVLAELSDRVFAGRGVQDFFG